ncbi:MAG: sigma 54-interacting transcriptional regulator [Phycisphaerae bacterium]
MTAESSNDFEIVARSGVMRQVLALVDEVARSNCSVLIEGDSGTGKELIARRIHAQSDRCQGPFVPVNCAGISSGVFESQLFGHVKGSFTGADQTTLGLVRCADHGTLFLDEIGEMALELQPKLLRVMQEREVMPVGMTSTFKVDVRFVVATNRNLLKEMQRGAFREDLYYRLNVVSVYVPPLHARREDIGPLLDHFLIKFAGRSGKPVCRVSQRVRDRLTRYAWPGNVRELATWVERLYATSISPELLTMALELQGPPRIPAARTSLRRDVAAGEDERALILRALEATGNNHTRAAELLQIHRGTLLRKMQRYQITDPGR